MVGNLLYWPVGVTFGQEIFFPAISMPFVQLKCKQKNLQNQNPFYIFLI